MNNNLEEELPKIHWDILDQQRMGVLPLLSKLHDEGFYLAGGTGLALQIGHRDSIDFDFFKKENFDTAKLFEKVQDIFAGHKIVKTQDEKDTLSVEIDENIKLNFFTFPYELVGDLMETEYFLVASVLDIATMKLNALTSRSVLKDYVDMYFILKEKTLEEIIDKLKVKIPTLDVLLTLKSLVYFEDVGMDPIIFKTESVSFDEVKISLQKKVSEFQRK